MGETALRQLFHLVEQAQQGPRAPVLIGDRSDLPVAEHLLGYIAEADNGVLVARPLPDVVLDLLHVIRNSAAIEQHPNFWVVLNHSIGLTMHPATYDVMRHRLMSLRTDDPSPSRSGNLLKTAREKLALEFPERRIEWERVDGPQQFPRVPSITEIVTDLAGPGAGRRATLFRAWKAQGLTPQRVVTLATLHLACQRLVDAELPVDEVYALLLKNYGLFSYVNDQWSALEAFGPQVGDGNARPPRRRGLVAAPPHRALAAFGIAAARVLGDPSWDESQFGDTIHTYQLLGYTAMQSAPELRAPARFHSPPDGHNLVALGRVLQGDFTEETLHGFAGELDAAASEVCDAIAPIAVDVVLRVQNTGDAVAEVLRAGTAAARQARSRHVYTTVGLLVRRFGMKDAFFRAANDLLLGAQRRREWWAVDQIYEAIVAELDAWDGPERFGLERREQTELAMAGTYTIRAEQALRARLEPGAEPNTTALKFCSIARSHANEARSLCDRLAGFWDGSPTIPGVSGPHWRLMPIVMLARAVALDALAQAWHWLPARQTPDAHLARAQKAYRVLAEATKDPYVSDRIQWEACNVRLIIALICDHDDADLAARLLAEAGGDRQEVGGRILDWLASQAEWRRKGAPWPLFVLDMQDRALRIREMGIVPETAPNEPRLPDLSTFKKHPT